nr:acyl-CoA dehydrogenase family protein [Sphingobacterium hungaricum]
MRITTDYYEIDDLLSADQLLIRQSIRDFVSKELEPPIEDCAQAHTEIPDLMKKLGKAGALGSFIPSAYGGAGLDQLSYGLIMQELEMGDSAIRSAASVQSSLVMYPIFAFGSEEQKRKFLPKLASGELVGSFGLTEPNHGSDPAGMETRLTKDGKGYRLNGSKLWITNAPTCDVAVVWARDDSKKVRGVLVERGMDGFSTPETLHKWSLRASRTGELVFDELYISEENILPEVNSMRGPLSCLNSARYGISWGAIGAAIDCYQTALSYSLIANNLENPLLPFNFSKRNWQKC